MTHTQIDADDRNISYHFLAYNYSLNWHTNLTCFPIFPISTQSMLYFLTWFTLYSISGKFLKLICQFVTVKDCTNNLLDEKIPSYFCMETYIPFHNFHVHSHAVLFQQTIQYRFFLESQFIVTVVTCIEESFHYIVHLFAYDFKNHNNILMSLSSNIITFTCTVINFDAFLLIIEGIHPSSVFAG